MVTVRRLSVSVLCFDCGLATHMLHRVVFVRIKSIYMVRSRHTVYVYVCMCLCVRLCVCSRQAYITTDKYSNGDDDGRTERVRAKESTYTHMHQKIDGMRAFTKPLL